MLRLWSRWRTQSRDRGLECQNVDVFPSSSEARCICSDQQVVQILHRPGRGASDGDKKSLYIHLPEVYSNMSSAFPSSDGASVDVDARPIHRFRPLVIERSRGILEAFLSPPNAIMITKAHGQMHACPTSGLPGMPCHDVVGDHSGGR